MRVRIPPRFLLDHVERDLPTPRYEPCGSGFLIDLGDPELAELVSDASYYASSDGPDDLPLGLRTAARALLKSLASYGVGVGL